MNHWHRVAVALAICTASFGASAQDGTTVSARDFARPPQMTLPTLSPSGDYLAVAVRDSVDADDGSHYEIGVFHLPDMKPISKLDVPEHYVPADIHWVSDTRLVILPAKEIGSLEEPVAGGEMMATDYDGKNQKRLFGLSTNVQGQATPMHCRTFSGVPEKLNGHFYVACYGNHQYAAKEGESSIYDVDSSSGKAEPMGGINFQHMQFLVHNGQALIAFGVDDQLNTAVFMRKSSSDAWARIQAKGHLLPLAISADGQTVYWRYSPSGGPYGLAQSNLDVGNLKMIASDPSGDIDAIEMTPNPSKPFAATIYVGKPKTIYLDDDNWTTAHKALSEQYPDYAVEFAGMSQDGSRVLVHGYNDRDPGFYALFSFTPVSLKVLYRVEPWIDSSKMSVQQPIAFKNRDGTMLDGYLTMPPRGSHLPLVLLPHGGPIDIRDDWSFDPWAQFLASRGYAVLQVNFRGSSGRGYTFMKAGYKQYGTGIQQDLIDGVQWAVAQGYADKNRVCVFGASFGGYSALMAPILAPDMFKCAVDYAGISDFAILRDDDEQKYGDDLNRFAFAQQIGLDDATLKAISPIYHLDAFNIPVLIVHGEKDERVPVKNAEVLRDALQKSGKPYEWLVKPKELHGFYSEENNTDMLEHLQAFLDKYIGADAPDAAGNKAN
jgi:dipeptidyl aminopeptidase/acylaminoacyl peptidase